MIVDRPVASIQVPFSSVAEAGGGGSLRLVEDSTRHVEPVRSGPSLGVYAATSRYVRLYPQRHSGTVVSAVTGKVSFAGNSYDEGVEDVIMLTPDKLYGNVPVGATDVEVSLIGSVLSPDGVALPLNSVGVWYDQNSRTVKVNKPCYAVVKVVYNEGYSIYKYTFDGSCSKVTDYTNDFKTGVVYAIDKVLKKSTSLNLEVPKCLWPIYTPTEGENKYDREPVDIAVEIDPDFEPCFRTIAGNIHAFAQVRVYPADGVYKVRATNAIAAMYSDTYQEYVEDGLLMNGSSSVSLSRPPFSGVSLYTTVLSSGKKGFGGVRGPKSTVTEVDYNADGSYTNPRKREVGPMEVVAVDSYGHVTEVTASVDARYTTSYKKMLVQFIPHWLTPVGPTFYSSWVFVGNGTGQAASLRVDPPTLQSQSTDKSKGVGR